MTSRPKILFHAFFILFFLVGTQAVQANSGRAFSIKGTVTVNDEPLRLYTEIKEGDAIKTGAGSSVKIIMKDKTVLDIVEKTSFKITKYAYNKEAPEESRSSFSLFEGTFRYISGLIAKKDPDNVKMIAGTATIGIRGTLTTIGFDGTEVKADSSIGTTEIKFADGTSLKVTAGQSGSFNFSTGRSSVGPSTTADTIGAAALAIAADPAQAAATLAGMTDAEAILVLAAIMNNATQLGVDSSKLTSIVSNAVAANPTMAVGLAYVAGALNGSDAVTTAITANVPDLTPAQKAEIESVSEQGKDLKPAPETKTFESLFPLRQGVDPNANPDPNADPNDPGSSTTGSGSPLSTQEFIDITSES
jgi:FecR protein